MNEDKKKLKDLLDKIPDNLQAARFGHTVIGALRWYYKDLT